MPGGMRVRDYKLDLTVDLSFNWRSTVERFLHGAFTDFHGSSCCFYGLPRCFRGLPQGILGDV